MGLRSEKKCQRCNPSSHLTDRSLIAWCWWNVETTQPSDNPFCIPMVAGDCLFPPSARQLIGTCSCFRHSSLTHSDHVIYHCWVLAHDKLLIDPLLSLNILFLTYIYIYTCCWRLTHHWCLRSCAPYDYWCITCIEVLVPIKYTPVCAVGKSKSGRPLLMPSIPAKLPINFGIHLHCQLVVTYLWLFGDPKL